MYGVLKLIEAFAVGVFYFCIFVFGISMIIKFYNRLISKSTNYKTCLVTVVSKRQLREFINGCEESKWQDLGYISRSDLGEIITVSVDFLQKLQSDTKISNDDRCCVDRFEFKQICDTLEYLQQYGNIIPVSRIKLMLDFVHKRLKMCFEDGCTTQYI